MKRLVLILLFCLITAPLIAGVVGSSPYDKVWDIYVFSCSGKTVVYHDCAITNLGEYAISFIPNQGRIPTGNGPEIIIQKDSCTEIQMVEKR